MPRHESSIAHEREAVPRPPETPLIPSTYAAISSASPARKKSSLPSERQRELVPTVEESLRNGHAP